MNFRLKKITHKLLRNRYYEGGIWYENDGTPSKTSGQKYDENTGNITITTGNGGTIVTKAGGNTSNTGDGNDGGGNTSINTPQITPQQETPVEENIPKVSSVFNNNGYNPTYETPTGTNEITNTPLGNNLKLTYDGQNTFNPNKKVSNNGLYQAKAYDKIKTYNPDGSVTMTQLTPKGAAEYNFNNANQFGFNNNNNNNNYNAEIPEDVKIKEYLANNTPDTTYSQGNPSSSNTPNDSSTPNDATPKTTTTDTEEIQEPKIEESPLYQYLDNLHVIGEYVFDKDLIDDEEAYNAIVQELTEKFGSEATSQFLSAWTKDYIERYGVSPAKVRKGLVSYEDVYYGKYGGSSGTGTVTDEKNKLQQKLASLSEQYANNTSLANAKESNSDIAKAKKDSNTNLRLAKKNFNETANASGLAASGFAAQESEAKDIAYKMKLAELNEQEQKNNKLIQKIKEAYENEIANAYEEYEANVEKIRAENAAKKEEINDTNVNIDVNGQSIYSFTDGTGRIKSYSRKQLIAAGKQNFVDSMDAEQRALIAYNYDRDIIPYTNAYNETYGTILLEGNGKTVKIADLDNMMYNGTAKAVFDGKYLTYYGIG